MTITLSSTSIKAKYLHTIPVSSVYRDPNGYSYQVVEKKMNNSLIKSAQHYLGQEIEPIILQNIPEDMLKKDNPNKANITKLMKSRINELEESVKQLLQQQHKSLYQRIQDLLDEKELKYHEINDTFYLLHSGIVFPFKKKYYPNVDAALSDLEKVADNLFKDNKMLQKMMHKQHSIQSKLYQELLNIGKSNEDDEVKEILLCHVTHNL
jgi:hypothetical protein